jgi:hypothetical protein
MLLTVTDDLSRGSEAETTDTTRLPRVSARLNWISTPAARRLLAMRRRGSPSAVVRLRSEANGRHLARESGEVSRRSAREWIRSWAPLTTPRESKARSSGAREGSAAGVALGGPRAAAGEFGPCISGSRYRGRTPSARRRDRRSTSRRPRPGSASSHAAHRTRGALKRWKLQCPPLLDELAFFRARTGTRCTANGRRAKPSYTALAPGPTAPREVPLLELPPMKAGSQPPKSEISFFWFRS